LESTLDCHDVIGGTARERVRSSIAQAELQLQSFVKAGAQEAIHAGA